MALLNSAARVSIRDSEDVGEPQQQRQPDALRVEVHRQLVEIEAALRIAIGMDGDVTLGVDPEDSPAPSPLML